MDQFVKVLRWSTRLNSSRNVIHIITPDLIRGHVTFLSALIVTDVSCGVNCQHKCIDWFHPMADSPLQGMHRQVDETEKNKSSPESDISFEIFDGPESNRRSAIEIAILCREQHKQNTSIVKEMKAEWMTGMTHIAVWLTSFTWPLKLNNVTLPVRHF